MVYEGRREGYPPGVSPRVWLGISVDKERGRGCWRGGEGERGRGGETVSRTISCWSENVCTSLKFSIWVGGPLREKEGGLLAAGEAALQEFSLTDYCWKLPRIVYVCSTRGCFEGARKSTNSASRLTWSRPGRRRSGCPGPRPRKCWTGRRGLSRQL